MALKFQICVEMVLKIQNLFSH